MPERSPLPFVQAVGRALPPTYVDQETLVRALKELWATRHFNTERIESVSRSVRVSGRHLLLPVEEYSRLDTFRKRNDAWIAGAVDLGEQAVRAALARAGLGPLDVDHLFFMSITGVATPSVDARLANRMELRPDVKRTPIFGLGCVGGAAGTARAADYLRAFPGEVAVLLSVELCSLTHQRQDASMANVIASSLFGDGAAAVVLTGGHRGRGIGPRVLASTSVFYAGTEDLMGWEIGDCGFKVLLSPKVPALVEARACDDVDTFLAFQGICREDIKHWVLHTGGPKVLEAFQSALELPPDALSRSWESLSRTGNLSSASVLFVLGDLLDSGDAEPGDLGLMLAMGPGFCAEMVLLQW